MDDDLKALRLAAGNGDAVAQEQLGRELVSGATPTGDTFAEGLDWIQRAASQGALSATIVLGHLHCQYPTLPDAAQQAFRAYEAAGKSGHPEALVRLADLHMFGYGVERNDSKAWSILENLCATSFPHVLCQAAYLRSRGLGCDADEAHASTLLLRAAAQGETLAFVLLAQRYQHGYGLPQRPDIALAWWQLAQRRHWPGADDAAARLAGQLARGERAAAGAISAGLMENIRGLSNAVAALDTAETDPAFAARFSAAVAENFQRLGQSALSLDAGQRGNSQNARPAPQLVPRPLCWRPRVLMIDQFADDEETNWLLGSAQPLLVNTADQLAAGGQVEVDQFDGACAVFAPHRVTPVVRAIQRRWASVLHIESQHFEPMSVLRYQTGHEYAAQVDYFDSARMWTHRNSGDRGGQRLITGLICLLAADRGGETRYAEADLTVAVAPGSAIFHYNTTPEGLADPRSVHQGLPIEAGEKWLCRTAVRERKLYAELETVL